MTLSRFGNPRVFTLFFSLFLSSSVFSLDNFDSVTITANHVAGEGRMLMGQGGNIAVSTGDHGGTIAGLIQNLDTSLAQLPTTIQIIPDYGDLASRDDFALYVAGVGKTVEIVTRKIEAGATLHMLIADGLPARYADWGNGFISEQAWLTTTFNSHQSSTSGN